MKVHDPISLGFDPDRLDRIGTLMQRYVDEEKLPGFVSLVARRGKIAYLHTCGLMNREKNKPYQEDTIVRVFSMTKPITTVALLQLYEQSLFGLQDPISDFIPEFKETTVWENGRRVPPQTPITFQHVLTHTAGLSYGGFGAPDPHVVDQMYGEAKLFDKGRTLAETISVIASLPLLYHPGTQWRYSVATDVLGRLVEVISGQSLADYIEEHICGPLGMVDTAFHIDPAKVERFATLYNVTAEDPLAVLDDPDESRYLPPILSHSGGGGMVSTMPDYLQFATCLLNKGELNGVRILGRKTVERMRMNHLPPELLPMTGITETFYGLGFGLGVSSMIDITQSGIMGSNGDHGWSGLAETVFWIDPEEELIAINMTQCIPAGFYPVRKQFRTAVYQALAD